MEERWYLIALKSHAACRKLFDDEECKTKSKRLHTSSDLGNHVSIPQLFVVAYLLEGVSTSPSA